MRFPPYAEIATLRFVYTNMNHPAPESSRPRSILGIYLPEEIDETSSKDQYTYKML